MAEYLFLPEANPHGRKTTYLKLQNLIMAITITNQGLIKDSAAME
ncbi:MAG: hypothetical protein ABIN89_29830 [Chitinophagaceae bacterium]